VTVQPQDLVGRWRFERVIADAFADRTLDVSGTLTISPESDDALIWREEGVLHCATELPVWRTYRIERRATGWMMTFDDGRDFHPWSIGEEVVHGCGADTYRATYTIDADSAWRVVWGCTGPAKDYVMTTRYRPADHDDEGSVS